MIQQEQISSKMSPNSVSFFVGVHCDYREEVTRSDGRFYERCQKHPKHQFPGFKSHLLKLVD